MPLKKQRKNDVVGRLGTIQGKKVMPRYQPSFEYCCNTSSESYLSSSGSNIAPESISSSNHSLSDINEPICYLTEDINDGICDQTEPVRCSTPLHLPCPIEFSLPPESTDCISDESSSDDGFALFEGSKTSTEGLIEILHDFMNRHSIPDNAMKELLTILKQLLPSPNNVPNRDGSQSIVSKKNASSIL